VTLMDNAKSQGPTLFLHSTPFFKDELPRFLVIQSPNCSYSTSVSYYNMAQNTSRMQLTKCLKTKDVTGTKRPNTCPNSST